jgi:hypothetical protein
VRAKELNSGLSIRGNDRAVWRRGFAASLTEECDDMALQSMHPAIFIVESYYFLAVQLTGSHRLGNISVSATEWISR